MRKSRLPLIMFVLLLVTFAVLNAWMIGPFLLAVLMGGILAVLSYPIYCRLRAHRWNAKLASFAVTIGILLVVIVPLGGFGTLAVRQGIAAAQILGDSPQLSFKSVSAQLGRWPVVSRFAGDTAEIEKQARAGLQSAGKAGTAAVLSIVSNVPNLLLQVALALISCFFFLIDGRRFLGWTRDKIPLEPDARDAFIRSFHDTTISVIWATLAAAAVQAGIMLGSYLALGVPGAFLAAGATFVFAWIPVLGSTPVWLFGAGYLWFEDSPGKALAMIALGLICSVADNFVRPLILKGRGDMHPLVSLVAIFGGIEMFGIFGVFIGPILAAVLITLLQIWPVIARRFGLLSESRTAAPVDAREAAEAIPTVAKHPDRRKAG